jgi:hypothetical protein
VRPYRRLRAGTAPQQLFGWRRSARLRAEDGSGDRSAAFAPVIVEAARPGPAMPDEQEALLAYAAPTVPVEP